MPPFQRAGLIDVRTSAALGYRVARNREAATLSQMQEQGRAPYHGAAQSRGAGVHAMLAAVSLTAGGSNSKRAAEDDRACILPSIAARNSPVVSWELAAAGASPGAASATAAARRIVLRPSLLCTGNITR